jgi:hypothetical protein
MHVFSKAWLYIKLGAEKYRDNDAFDQPPSNFDECLSVSNLSELCGKVSKWDIKKIL